MDLSYTIPQSNPLVVPQAPSGRPVSAKVVVGPEAEPVLRLVITALPPLRRNGGERYLLWLVNSRGTTNGSMAVRDTYAEILAVASKVAEDLRLKALEAAGLVNITDTKGA